MRRKEWSEARESVCVRVLMWPISTHLHDAVCAEALDGDGRPGAENNAEAARPALHAHRHQLVVRGRKGVQHWVA